MIENTRLIELEKSIKKYNEEAVTKIVRFKNLKKEFLFVCTKGASFKVQLFDGLDGFNAIGIIGYSRVHNPYISTFEVAKKYQNKGVGRFLFNFALAHTDKLGSTNIRGEAMPINDIVGIKGSGRENHIAHKMKLVEIYKKLGCTIEDVELSEDEYPTFSLEWKPGDRYSALDEQSKDLVDMTIEQQRKFDKNKKF